MLRVYQEVYFIDFCPSEIEIKKIEKIAKKLIVIDHHIGKEDLVKSLANSVFRNGVSGAYLAQEYFFPQFPYCLCRLPCKPHNEWQARRPRYPK